MLCKHEELNSDIKHTHTHNTTQWLSQSLLWQPQVCEAEVIMLVDETWGWLGLQVQKRPCLKGI